MQISSGGGGPKNPGSLLFAACRYTSESGGSERNPRGRARNACAPRPWCMPAAYVRDIIQPRGSRRAEWQSALIDRGDRPDDRRRLRAWLTVLFKCWRSSTVLVRWSAYYEREIYSELSIENWRYLSMDNRVDTVLSEITLVEIWISKMALKVRTR